MVPLVAPVHALALDADLKGSAIFKVEASNGYTILGFAASERLDGRTDIGLSVSKGNSGATYVAPAVVTPTRVEVDLGNLGRISLAVEPSGVKRTLRSRCGGDPVTVEPDVYRGRFEFRGEEGYTEAHATTLPEYTRFLPDLICVGPGRGGVSGPDLPGAQLTMRRGHGHRRVELKVNKNRSSARTRLEVEVHEKRGRMEIARGAALWTAGGAFTYDPLLRTATLAPAPPFSGEAAFHRNAAPASRWTGDLAVDLPGRSDVTLTGIGARATLIPFCWHEGEGRFRC
jgi:hypothetical protein